MTGPENESEANMDDSTDVTPRLFRLPDLKPPVAPPQAAMQAATEVVSPVASALNASRESLPFMGGMTGSTAANAYSDHRSGAAEERSPVSQAFTNPSAEIQPSANPSNEKQTERSLDTAPAGRSWMESAVIHHKVLVLLLVAVGAAMWTARGGDDDTASDSTLADTSGLSDLDPLQIEAGQVVAQSQPQIAGNQIAGNQTAAAEPVVEEGTEPSIETVAKTVSEHADVAPSSTTLASNAAAPESDSSVANDPADFQPAPVHLEGPPSIASITPPSANFRTQVNVQPVSTRTPHNPGIEAPSLEELQVAAKSVTSHQANRTSTELSVQESNTPHGVSDWLQYLPATAAK